MQDKRPSERELSKKIRDAKESLTLNNGIFANPSKAVGELNDLDIGDTNEIWSLIKELLDEIDSEHYVGTRPPLKSYEKIIVGVDLFAFSWCSNKLGKKMYIKFALKHGRYYYVSLHQCRGTQ